MGLVDIAVQLQKNRNKKASKRLFEYVSRNRAQKERLPLEVGDSLRASYLPYLCPREEVLASRYDVIRVEFIRPSLEITWSIGHTFHNLYRDIYFGPMQEWGGAWECKRCGWDTDEAGLSSPPVFTDRQISSGHLAKMPSECGGCGAPFREMDGIETSGTFKEWFVEDKVLGINGHPDGWSIRNGVSRVLTDLKSHSYNGFLALNRLRPGHDLQVWAYQHMCGDLQGEVWYLNKSPWGEPSAFLKDIPVHFDREEFKELVVKPVELVRDGVAGGKIPDRSCVDPLCSKAKDCQLVDVCFEA